MCHDSLDFNSLDLCDHAFNRYFNLDGLNLRHDAFDWHLDFDSLDAGYLTLNRHFHRLHDDDLFWRLRDDSLDHNGLHFGSAASQDCRRRCQCNERDGCHQPDSLHVLTSIFWVSMINLFRSLETSREILSLLCRIVNGHRELRSQEDQ